MLLGLTPFLNTLRLNSTASRPMSSVSRTGAIDDIPANSSRGLVRLSHHTSSTDKGIRDPSRSYSKPLTYPVTGFEPLPCSTLIFDGCRGHKEGLTDPCARWMKVKALPNSRR